MKRAPQLSLFAATAGVLAGLSAAPASAQRLGSLDTRAVDTVVVGESQAAQCYTAASSSLIETRSTYARHALASCNSALDSDGLNVADQAATLVNRAIVRRATGDLAGAAADLERAVARVPGLQEAQLTLGGVYANMARWADAETALSLGIALDPSVAVAEDYFTRASAREELGDLAGAYDDYRTAAELSPGWSAPRLELERFMVAPNAGNGGA